MQGFKPIALDHHRTAPLLQDEIELFVAEKVAIYSGEEAKPRHEDGVARLTSHRILWIGSGTGLALELSNVLRFEVKSGFLSSSPKIILHIRSQEANVVKVAKVSWKCPACDEINQEDSPLKCGLCGTINPNPPTMNTSNADNAISAHKSEMAKLSFRGSGHSKFAEFLGKALDKAAWAEEERRLKAAAASQVDAPLIAGVAGLMKRAEEGRSKQLATQTEAFSDLDALMGRAGEMAKLAETIARKLSAHEATVSDAQDRDFQRLLLDLGLTGATASASREGSIYVSELARQLSVFLGKLFDLRQVQMMALSDIYCIYNRARGNDLVSPQDLFRAASQFEGLGLPMRLRTMSSGLLVVQSAAFSEEQVVKRLFDSFFSQATSVSPFDMATREGISTQLATELLLECERHGRVCRDLSPSGIQFFPNRFLTDFT